MSQTLSAGTRVSADLRAEVDDFYAHQMPLLEGREVEAFAATFTDDCVFGYGEAWQIQGRDGVIKALGFNLPRYGTSTIRHWFESRRIAPDGDSLIVTSSAIVSVTHEDGTVVLEPSCTVNDVLVRRAGELATASRIIVHDMPDPAAWFASQAGRA
jgi:ketosteroid isomerase-like protein